MDLSPLTKNQNKKCMRLKKQKSKEGKHGKRKRKSSRQKEPKSPNKVSAADRIRSKFKDIGTIKDNRLILHKNVDNAGLFNHGKTSGLVTRTRLGKARAEGNLLNMLQGPENLEWNKENIPPTTILPRPSLPSTSTRQGAMRQR